MLIPGQLSFKRRFHTKHIIEPNKWNVSINTYISEIMIRLLGMPSTQQSKELTVTRCNQLEYLLYGEL